MRERINNGLNKKLIKFNKFNKNNTAKELKTTENCGETKTSSCYDSEGCQ